MAQQRQRAASLRWAAPLLARWCVMIADVTCAVMRIGADACCAAHTQAVRRRKAGAAEDATEEAVTVLAPPPAVLPPAKRARAAPPAAAKAPPQAPSHAALALLGAYSDSDDVADAAPRSSGSASDSAGAQRTDAFF
jgi:hypothetical protein